MKEYQVNLITNDYVEPIDTITAPDGYTPNDYIKGCEENADPEWIEMIHSGDIVLIEVS